MLSTLPELATLSRAPSAPNDWFDVDVEASPSRRSHRPATVELTQDDDLQLLVAALDQSEGRNAQELRDGLVRMIGDSEPDA